MITALTGAAEKIPAPSRPSGEEALKRRETPKPVNLLPAETDSAVVEISREGARRAQIREQEQPALAQQASDSINKPGSDAVLAAAAAASKPADAQSKQEAGAESVADAEATQPQAALKQATAGDAPSELSILNEFDEADANQDGTVNVLEKRAFDFMHPTLARYPGDPEDSAQRTVAAELKAYEAVARSGRNL